MIFTYCVYKETPNSIFVSKSKSGVGSGAGPDPNIHEYQNASSSVVSEKQVMYVITIPDIRPNRLNKAALDPIFKFYQIICSVVSYFQCRLDFIYFCLVLDKVFFSSMCIHEILIFSLSLRWIFHAYNVTCSCMLHILQFIDFFSCSIF